MMTTDFRAMVNGEIEDLLPRSVIVMILDRYLKGPVEQPFAPEDNAPIVPQVKEYAVKHNIELAEGWKVEVARMVKARLAAMKPTDAAISGELAGWAKLMASLAPEVDSRPGPPARPRPTRASQLILWRPSATACDRRRRRLKRLRR